MWHSTNPRKCIVHERCWFAHIIEVNNSRMFFKFFFHVLNALDGSPLIHLDEWGASWRWNINRKNVHSAPRVISQKRFFFHSYTQKSANQTSTNFTPMTTSYGYVFWCVFDGDCDLEGLLSNLGIYKLHCALYMLMQYYIIFLQNLQMETFAKAEQLK